MHICSQFVSQCNEGARSTERLEEMWRVSAAIHVPPALRNAPELAPALSRRDRKYGNVLFLLRGQLWCRDTSV